MYAKTVVMNGSPAKKIKNAQDVAQIARRVINVVILFKSRIKMAHVVTF